MIVTVNLRQIGAAAVGVMVCASAYALDVSGPSTIVHGLPDRYFVVLLIVSGILLMLVEMKVVSYGLLSLGGIACMVFACAILMRTGETLFGLTPRMLVPVLLAITVVELMLVLLSLKSIRGEPATGTDSFIGQIAEVSRALSPEGKVFFNGGYWDAVSASPVAAGRKVRILAADQLKLTVAPLE